MWPTTAEFVWFWIRWRQCDDGFKGRTRCQTEADCSYYDKKSLYFSKASTSMGGTDLVKYIEVIEVTLR